MGPPCWRQSSSCSPQPLLGLLPSKVPSQLTPSRPLPRSAHMLLTALLHLLSLLCQHSKRHGASVAASCAAPTNFVVVQKPSGCHQGSVLIQLHVASSCWHSARMQLQLDQHRVDWLLSRSQDTHLQALVLPSCTGHKPNMTLIPMLTLCVGACKKAATTLSADA